MSRQRIGGAALVLLIAREAAAQAPVAPTAAEFAAIRAAVEAREIDAAMALRSRWRLGLGLGLVATTSFDARESIGELRFEGGFSGAIFAALTRGITEVFDVAGRLEVAAPQEASVLPAEAAMAVAGVPCTGSRRFERPRGAGALGALDVGLRARLFDARSPFFVGIAMRAAVRWNDVAGAWSVWCEGADGTRARLAGGEVRGAPPRMDLGASLETGYRFGARASWEVGLRLSLGGLTEGDIATRLGQWYLAWSPW